MRFEKYVGPLTGLEAHYQPGTIRVWQKQISLSSHQSDFIFTPQQDLSVCVTWRTHFMRRLYFHNIYDAVLQDIMNYINQDMYWIDKLDGTPYFIVSFVQICFDKTTTVTIRTALVIFSVYAFLFECSVTYRICITKNELSSIGSLRTKCQATVEEDAES